MFPLQRFFMALHACPAASGAAGADYSRDASAYEPHRKRGVQTSGHKTLSEAQS